MTKGGFGGPRRTWQASPHGPEARIAMVIAPRRGRFALGTVLVVVAGLIVAVPSLVGVAFAECSQSVDVQVDQDACAGVVAASVTGDASGHECTQLISCISLSGTGTASNTGGYFSCGNAASSGPPGVGCIAASGTGNASNSGGACGYADGRTAAAGCVAVSGTGQASNTGNSCGGGAGFSALVPASGAGAGCIAVSGTGDASNTGGPISCGYGAGGFGVGVGAGCIALSGAGDASNTGRTCGFGISNLGAGAGLGCIAVSGTGNASNTGDDWSCGIAVATLPFPTAAAGIGCVAVSGGGDASNTAGENSCGVAGIPLGVGVGIGCIAASGMGSATNTAGPDSCGFQFGLGGVEVAVGCLVVFVYHVSTVEWSPRRAAPAGTRLRLPPRPSASVSRSMHGGLKT
jgi:hypothetical protein